jgi:UDP-2-acetamido-3-amino-2,3-dideoxy-glucuronate N-acetyltransferase
MAHPTHLCLFSEGNSVSLMHVPTPEDPSFFVHETALVEAGAAIGAGTKIWHFCHLMPGCQIGEACNLGQNVFVGQGVVLGRNVKVQNNVSLYEGVMCEDDVFIGPSAVFTNVRNPRSAIIRKGEYRLTYLERGVTVGANATIVCGVRLHRYSFIGAGTVVLHDVPAYALVVGNPGRQIGWMSEYGAQLAFDASGFAVCAESGQRYQCKDDAVTRVE